MGDAIMEPQDPSLADGEYTVVSYDNLAYATANGARLVRILMVDQPHREHVPGSYTGGCHVPDRHEFKALARVAMFVLFTPRESVSAKLVGERDNLSAELRRTREALAQLQSERMTKEVAVKDLQEQIHRNDKMIDEERMRARKAQERSSKMEQDIAKLRKALGEIEMKRILET